jgi:hypothetical protein
MHFILGGSWYPSTYTSLLAGQSGLDHAFFDSRMVSLFGVAELGLGIGIQTPHLSSQRTPDSFPNPTGASPMVFSLDSNRFFVESIQGKIAVTVLSPNAPIPFLRYLTGDLGEIFRTQANTPFLFSIESRKPDSSLPYPIFEDQVEEHLYRHPELFDSITGDFLIRKDSITFEVHENVFHTEGAKTRLELRLKEILKVQCSIHLTPHLKYKNHISADLLRKPRVYE